MITKPEGYINPTPEAMKAAQAKGLVVETYMTEAGETISFIEGDVINGLVVGRKPEHVNYDSGRLYLMSQTKTPGLKRLSLGEVAAIAIADAERTRDNADELLRRGIDMYLNTEEL